MTGTFASGLPFGEMNNDLEVIKMYMNAELTGSGNSDDRGSEK